jgi:pimeloyl-ACP methyl ester carboxylesterase
LIVEVEDVSRILVETSTIGDIPVLTMAPEFVAPRPAVFFVHGFMSDKREGLALGYELARQGFYFVSLDAPMHGLRFDPRLEAMVSGKGEYVYPFESGLDVFYMMHEIIVQIARDLERLIAYFEGERRIDGDRVGLTGFSMGGFATFYAAANNPRIAAAVPIAGIPAFEARWRDVVLETSAYEKWAAAMREAQAESARRGAFVQSIDPFEKLAGFFPRPLMMISGDLDTHSPKKYSVDLYRELLPVYAEHPERLRLVIHDEAGHELTRAMMEDVCGWFSRYL